MKREKAEYNQHGLRQRLFEAMDALRDGEIEYMDASALAKLAHQIVESDRVEIEIHNQKMLDAKPVGSPAKIADKSRA